MNYILKNGKPVPEPDLFAFARWFENGENRRIGLTEVGQYVVSTVFLGIDHNFRGKGEAILFETLVSGPDKYEEIWRYKSMGDAKKGHAAIVAALRENLDPCTEMEKFLNFGEQK